MQSTQTVVERILGPPRKDINSDSTLSFFRVKDGFFRVKDGFLSVFYSSGLCEPGVSLGWNVEKGVVESIDFEPKAYPKFKSLKYKKSVEGDVGDIFTYRSREAGIEYTVQYGKVLAIIYFPGLNMINFDVVWSTILINNPQFYHWKTLKTQSLKIKKSLKTSFRRLKCSKIKIPRVINVYPKQK